MEFFLVIPMLVLVLAAGVQTVALTRARIELVGAAREGARVAATTPDPSRAVSAVLAALPSTVRDRARVSVTRPAVVGQPARVVVRVRHHLGAPFPDMFTVELSASASMLVER
ncbi:MAG: pilus assembly protein [Actinobacteria bacterium]|nr:pilus assembly protein [Actinomycetota bacterium]MCI0677604.1 pilus assembly protein [Actinomycetota bacterium]